MSMVEASDKKCKPMVKMEELFCNFSPDAAVVMTMMVSMMGILVKKNILTSQDVYEISIKLGELVTEVQESLS